MKYMLIFLSLIAALAMILPANAVFATSVSSTVSASARTGGNTAAVQNVKAGLSKASVSIKTMVDGVVVEDIERYEEGSAVELHEESSYVLGGNGSVTAKTETRAMAGENVAAHRSEEVSIKVYDVKITRDTKGTTTASTSASYSSPVLKVDGNAEEDIDSNTEVVPSYRAFAGIGILFQSFMDTIKYVFTKFF